MNTNSYFTVELLTAGTLGLQQPSGTGTSVTVYYWINKDPNAARDNYDGSITTSSSLKTIPNLVLGDKVKFYRAETTRWSEDKDNGWNNRFNGTAQYKFSGNIASLIGFSETLPTYCFQNIFYNCSVVDASELELPWTTLNNWCFGRMFFNCTKLTEPPYLPAETAVDSCYRLMFRNCTALKKICRMGCKNLAFASHYAMYQLCTGLEKVTLPLFDTYANQALAFMFNGCSGLKELTVECPETLSTKHMFYCLAGSCMNLERFTCLAKNSTANCTSNWLGNDASYAAEHATFIKHPDATFWPEGTSGIPSGWTVKNMKPTTVNIDYNNIAAAYVRGNHSLSAIYGKGGVLLWGTAPIDYNKTYLTFKILTDGTITYNKASSSATGKKIYYRKNNGSWVSISLSGSSTSSTINVVTGDIVEFYGSNSKYGENNTDNYCYFGGTASYDMYGNIRSLQGGENFMNSSLPWALGNYALYSFFKSCNIVDASNLIFDISSYGQEACSSMFNGCSSMVACTKILSGTSLDIACFLRMFKDCTSLVKAPELPATTLNYSSYELMFYGCSSLNYIKAMFTTTPGTLYTANWVAHVSSTGTYIKNSSASYTTRGFSFIPADWTVETADA